MKASLSIAAFAAGVAMMGVVCARLRNKAATGVCAVAFAAAAAGALALAHSSATPLPRPPSPEAFARRIVAMGHAYDRWSGRDQPLHPKEEDADGDGAEAPPSDALGVSAMRGLEPGDGIEDRHGTGPKHRRARRRGIEEGDARGWDGIPPSGREGNKQEE